MEHSVATSIWLVPPAAAARRTDDLIIAAIAPHTSGRRMLPRSSRTVIGRQGARGNV